MSDSRRPPPGRACALSCVVGGGGGGFLWLCVLACRLGVPSLRSGAAVVSLATWVGYPWGTGFGQRHPSDLSGDTTGVVRRRCSGCRCVASWAGAGGWWFVVGGGWWWGVAPKLICRWCFARVCPLNV